MAVYGHRGRCYKGRGKGAAPVYQFFIQVEKCPFSQKSALLFERKKAFYAEEKNRLCIAEKCPFLKLNSAFFQKSALLLERLKAFYGE